MEGPASLADERAAAYFAIEVHIAAAVDRDQPFRVGSPIPIRVVISNPSAQPVTVSLRDHDPHLGTLAYPDTLTAKVTNEVGKVLTENRTSDSEWWSSFYLTSQLRVEEPGDAIVIPAGQRVTRVVPLHLLLAGCPGLPKGLEAGTYVIQLRLMDYLKSNSLRFEVVGK